jgi:hypothetical protein
MNRPSALYYALRTAIDTPGQAFALPRGLKFAYKRSDDEHLLAVWRDGTYPSVGEIGIVQRTLREMGKTHMHAQIQTIKTDNGQPTASTPHAYHITWPVE